MAQFPRNEPEIKALAQNMVSGISANGATFPTPPVTPPDVQDALDSVIALSDAVVATRAAALKDAGIEELTTAMRSVLRYAEDAVNYSDAELSLIGWGGRSASVRLAAPGQVRMLEILEKGEDRLSLDWKKPADGGKVASYKIERRQRPRGEWTLISVALESETTLPDQARGIEWEYRVIAVNKAGEGIASNTVAAVV